MLIRCFITFSVILTISLAKPLEDEIEIPAKGTDQGLYNKEFHEGDILLVNRTKPHAKPMVLGREMATSSEDLIWPYSAIVYRTEDEVGCPNSPHCQLLMSAMDEYHKNSCVRFKEWTGEENYVSIFFNPSSGQCWSPVGMVGDVQRLSLGRRCWYKGIVLHELGHAVGFWHEMNRPDRDEYVQINFENIMNGFDFAFRKMTDDEVDLLDEPMDFKSVMMYDEYAFSKDQVSPTIQTRSGEIIGPLWLKNSLSDVDIDSIHKLYQCQSNNQNVSFPYDIHCEFAENVCGFKNAEQSIWKWKSSDRTSFVISRYNSTDGTPGRFISPNLYPVSPEDESRGPMGCVRFWSILQGDGSMKLSLKFETLDNITQLTYDENKIKEAWSTRHVQDQWQHHHVNIDVTQPFRLIFQSEFYDDIKSYGQIAIDDIEILYDGPCFSIMKDEPVMPLTLFYENVTVFHNKTQPIKAVKIKAKKEMEDPKIRDSTTEMGNDKVTTMMPNKDSTHSDHAVSGKQQGEKATKIKKPKYAHKFQIMKPTTS